MCECVGGGGGGVGGWEGGVVKGVNGVWRRRTHRIGDRSWRRMVQDRCRMVWG